MMTYWILPSSGIPFSCGTVQRLMALDQQTDEWQQRMKKFDSELEDKLNAVTSEVNPNKGMVLDLENEDEDFIAEFNKVIDSSEVKHEEEKMQQEADEIGDHDPYLNMELVIRDDPDNIRKATVKKRVIDHNGKPIGIASKNPMFDTRRYEVQYLDGTTEEVTANVIAENLLSQVDENGHRHLMLREIMDHRKTSEAVPKSEGTYKRGRHNVQKRTTKGWEILVGWKDGSDNWVSLKDLKESYPVQLADYAVHNRIADEPAFAWWVPFVL